MARVEPRPCVLVLCHSQRGSAHSIDHTAQPLSEGSQSEQPLSEENPEAKVSAQSPPPLSLPALCVDELSEALAEAASESGSDLAADSASASARSHPTSAAAVGLPPCLLRYALSFGPWHACHCGDAASAATFLCHPQYLHMRCSMGQGAQLSEEISTAARQAEAAQDEAASKSKASEANNQSALAAAVEWRWSLQLPCQLTALSLIRRVYLAHAAEWISEPQLVYQYIACAPDDTCAAQIARGCMLWFRQWSGRAVTVATWQTKPQQLIDRPSHLECGVGLSCVSLHPAGVLLAAGYASSSSLSMFDLDSGVVLFSLPLPSPFASCVTGLSFSPDGRLLACTGDRTADGSSTPACVFSVDDRSVVCFLEGHAGITPRFTWLPDSSAIMAKSEWPPLLVHSAIDGTLLHSIDTNDETASVWAIEARPDEIVVVDYRHVSVWSLTQHTRLRKLGEMERVAVSSDGSVALIVADQRQRRIPLVSTADGSTLAQILIPVEGEISDLAVSTQWIAVLLAESVLLFSRATGLLHQSVAVTLRDVAFSPDGSRLFGRTGSGVTSLSMASIPACPMSEEQLAELGPASVRVDGELDGFLFTSLTALRRIVRDITSSSSLSALPLLGHGKAAKDHDSSGLMPECCCTAFSADNSRVLVVRGGALESRQFRFFDLATLQLVSELPRCTLEHVHCIDWSSDGRFVAAASQYHSAVKLISVETKQESAAFGGRSSISALKFSRDSTRLAVATRKSTVTSNYDCVILSVPEMQEIARYDSDLEIISIEWSAGDSAVLVASAVAPWEREAEKVRPVQRRRSGAVALINPTDGQLIRTLLTCEHAQPSCRAECVPDCSYRIWGARFNADCSRIAAWTDDRWVRIVRCSDGALLHSIRLHLSACRVEWHPDGRSVYSLHNDCAVRHHTLPRSLWPVDDAAAASSDSVLSASSDSAPAPRNVSYSAFMDEGLFHRIVYED